MTFTQAPYSLSDPADAEIPYTENLEMLMMKSSSEHEGFDRLNRDFLAQTKCCNWRQVKSLKKT